MWTWRPGKPSPNRRGSNTELFFSAMKAAMRKHARRTNSSISLTSTSPYRRAKLVPLWHLSLLECIPCCRRRGKFTTSFDMKGDQLQPPWSCLRRGTAPDPLQAPGATFCR